MRTAVAMFEATDLMAFHRYIGQWNPSLDIEVAPVLDDEETAALSQDFIDDHSV